MNDTYEQIKQHLVDTNIIVKKSVLGIAVKVYPEKNRHILLTLTLRNMLCFSQGITDVGAHSCSFLY